ncbi:hypothetical protein DPMN_051449 [Dreissena polymorpha]|uniref:Uncharacterized protein n=1 Tax=Dreissena polymorpha TaxID=45954 RepID=A0A9D4CJG4_DREPO|nr:hypothetical protein DPMN_051449 [Dreissena polymorpha]
MYSEECRGAGRTVCGEAVPGLVSPAGAAGHGLPSTVHVRASLALRKLGVIHVSVCSVVPD